MFNTPLRVKYKWWKWLAVAENPIEKTRLPWFLLKKKKEMSVLELWGSVLERERRKKKDLIYNLKRVIDNIYDSLVI